jgi:prevent-host-death family protein
MKSVTLEQLRGELDALVAEAADGQMIEIVIDGRPVARMLSARVADDDDAIPANEVEEAFYGD